MYCPQCGQQQTTDITRFCSRCGFPLEGVGVLLSRGGMLPIIPTSSSVAPGEISARRKGVKQGALIFLLGALVVPVLGVLSTYTGFGLFEFLAAIAAVILFIGGPLRMLYAAMFEEGAPRPPYQSQASYQVPAIPPPPRVGALPPSAVNSAGSWRRPTTAELVNPPSVTENTTRLLDQQREPGSEQ